ncbi:MAG: sigma-70 family RNA polymerase sigma factor [Spirochaetes bacterium]|nr:sigma-70 family RNA polymerase sigma factor [Spirochaetota bacterium]
MIDAREQEELRDRDHAWIRAFQAGDRDAFDKLYMAYLKPLSFFIRRLRPGDPQEIEDHCQEIMLAIYQALPRFVVRSSFRAFLYTVATNHLRNLKRRKNPQSLDAPLYGESTGNTLKDLLPSSHPGHADEIYQSNLMAEMERAIAALPESAREVFLLKEFQGLTFAEIAEATRQTARNAQFLKNKANLTLRDHLAKAGFNLAENPA